MAGLLQFRDTFHVVMIRVIYIRLKLILFVFRRMVGIALGYGLDAGVLFDSRWGLGIFLFTTASRTALGPTHPPIHWVPGDFSLGIKRQGRGAIPPLPNTHSWRGA
jgi:hypothetical protein